MVLVAAVVAIVVVGKDRILSKIRGAASSRVTAAVDQVAGTPASPGDRAAAPGALTLPGLRKALKTAIQMPRDDAQPAAPPPGELEKVSYRAPLGDNAAYVTPVKPGPRRPAILWIHGGFNWGIDDGAWVPAGRDNDQTAIAFRKAGIAEMYPALRGASGNPGNPECFLGEVDDILAAAEFLAARPDVDPRRIYLGGHSTGAVMVLLAAESSTRFRTVFAFGPVADPRQYGESSCVPRGASPEETRPRAPIEFLHEIATPTFIIEGESGNAPVFPMMKKRVGSAPIQFLTIPGATHFSELAASYDVLARAILADTGERPAIQVTVEQIQAAMK